MKNKYKKIALFHVLAIVVGLLVNPPLTQAVYNDDQSTGYTNVRTGNLKITDTGIYDSNAAIRYQPGSDNHFTGNLSSSGGQQTMGSVNVILSTANTTGFSAGDIFYAYLSGPTNALEGSVLVATTPVAGQGVSVAVAPAVADLTTVVGVASAAISTGSTVGVYGYGFVMMLTTGTVNVGDALQTSPKAAGYAQADGITVSSATIGVAFAGGISAGGRIRVKLK